ncbi:MAG TPA: hypothetical protein VGR24_03120, partial [bacterium]|nr:hypothetical protein [bacterium]
GNGPGELSGWIRPTAEAARAQARSSGRPVRLTLALLPTQFAGGAELETVRSWRLFDRIIEPATCVRLAAGLGSLETLRRGALVHLGGDLWLSSRLAARAGLPAAAFSETLLIASRHRGFARIFVPTGGHAAALRDRGVPSDKIVVTGDPRAAAPAEAGTLAVAAPRDDIIALLPGSRDRFFRTAGPIFLEIAAALAAIRPQMRAVVVVAPFITPDTLAAVRHPAGNGTTPPVQWLTGDPWPVLTRARFALTLPGTSTLELAAAGIPFAVVLPTDHVALAPVEGLLEWIARITGLQRPLKRAILARYRARMQFLALPNQRAGRQIAPEWIGSPAAEDLARRVDDLLNDPPALAAMAAALSELYAPDAAAPSRIAASAYALAG